MAATYVVLRLHLPFCALNRGNKQPLWEQSWVCLPSVIAGSCSARLMKFYNFKSAVLRTGFSLRGACKPAWHEKDLSAGVGMTFLWVDDMTVSVNI